MPRSTTRVCIMDDEAQVRAVLRAILEQAGYAVMEAVEGRAGLQVVETCRPAVAFVDLFMPGQKGVETIVALRRRAPAVKIIAMSGGGQRGQFDALSAAMLLGAYRAIRKPCTAQEMLAVVQDLTDGEASPASCA